MIHCFKKYLPENVTWTEPEGGLFLFVTLPSEIDTDNVLEKAVKRNVAFVAGSTFFCNESGHNTMRINFSFSDPEVIEEGVKRLAIVLKEELKAKQQ